MRLSWPFVLAIINSVTSIASKPSKRSHDTHNYYAIEHDPKLASLDDTLSALGVELVEQVGQLENHWLVRTIKLPPTSLSTRQKNNDPVVQRYKEMKAREIQPRSTKLPIRSDDTYTTNIARSLKYLDPQTLRRRVKRAPPPISPPAKAVAQRLGIEDPLFTEQWHLVNDEVPEHMMNVSGVWELGITGKGVLSSMVDDGLDYESEDLKDNFDAKNSYDFNDHEDLPKPKLFDDHHGTRCAGQIAAIKNNVCGVGIAYESKVAGVRILSGSISDVDEAAALNYGFQEVSIYSCSWGPPDNGRSMEGPSYLIKKAVINGINNGRGGKGSIFVFASGNGAGHGDQCNFDGYTNSIYSVTVSAIDYKGLRPYYSEACAANMIVAYSSGSGRSIVTTDVGKNECSRTHGGTSAAAPNAAGVFSLALEANPNLTWRDIQYLCIQTARIVNPEDSDWEKIASGRLYSYKYGFGALDAYAYVTAARDWQLVRPQTWLRTRAAQLNNGTMDEDEKYTGGEFIPDEGLDSSIEITQEMLDTHNFENLEHITIKVWIDHTKRGDVEVNLLSPNRIKSVLAAQRSGDTDATGYPGWTFMTVKHWGENPVGKWMIHVNDQGNHNTNNGSFIGWNMILWGSSVDPAKAAPLDLQPDNNVFPPPDPEASIPSSSTTLTKPTVNLPEDHAEASGENSLPAFSTSPAVSSPTGEAGGHNDNHPPAVSATPDEGWFPGLSNLVSNQKWFFGAIGAVAIFGIGAGVFFWRRRVAQRRQMAGYGSLPGDDVGMSALNRSGDLRSASGGGRGAGDLEGNARTRELYDAFGEVSDDDEDEDDADEQTQLRPSGGRGTGGTGVRPERYRDNDDDTLRPADPRKDSDGRTQQQQSGSVSPAGSWEHAS